MTNPAFDLASLAQGGKPAEKLPGRSRRRSQNPFAPIVQRVADEKLTWEYPGISAVVAENGGTSAAVQVESGIRQAGNALDKADKDSGGPGWKTIVRKVPSADGTEVTISFTVERRGDVPTPDLEKGAAPAEESASSRRRRGQ